MTSLPTLYQRVRNHRLPQRNAAVVGRHSMMNKDFESFTAQTLDRRRRQKLVLKNATGQRDAIQLLVFIDTLAHDHDQISHSQVKSCRNNSRGNAVDQICDSRTNYFVGAYDTPIIRNLKL